MTHITDLFRLLETQHRMYHLLKTEADWTEEGMEKQELKALGVESRALLESLDVASLTVFGDKLGEFPDDFWTLAHAYESRNR